MTKKDLRQLYKQKRSLLSKTERETASQKIFERFLAFFRPQAGQKVHIFLPIEKLHELDTLWFVRFFWESEIRVFVPRMLGEELISVELHPDTQLIKNSWGIPEPVDSTDSGYTRFDFVITPLLVSDKKGNRVGYGKGFYDRFFKSLTGNCKKVGINYFAPVEEIEDVEETDIPIDYLVTPDGVFSTEVLSEGAGTGA